MIIGIVGPMYSGKTTLALRLAEEDPMTVRVRFAGPLKDMLKTLGLSDEQVDGSLKEVPCDLLGGKTPRHAMQTLGTEWGRELITEDLWIRAWKHKVKRCSTSTTVVVDDCRFPNEVDAIHGAAGIIIRVTRPGYEHTATHESEAHELPADFEVVNDGTIDDLVSSFHRAFREWRSANALI